MEKLSPPKPLSLTGNLLENWKKWKQDFDLYMVAALYEDKGDKIKASLLLHCIGEKAREV